MRSNRTDATSALLRIAAEQEKYYIQNNRYGSYAELGSPATEHGWYTLTVPAADATTYTATATAAAGGPQEHDDDCQAFTVDAEGRHTAADSGGADASELCW
jgi:Tfp pilus assembly protein PilE